MEYRAGQPQEEVGIDGCGLCSLARTFARCARTSGYEFNHRAGPGLTQMPRCETGQRRRPQGDLRFRAPPRRRLRTPPRSAIGRSQGGGSWASMTVIQEGAGVRLRRAGTSGTLPVERQISYFRHVGYGR